MIRVPTKNKKAISQELKKFQIHIQNLVSKGKSATEEDARILINDIISDVLGYDKYNDLKTEFKDKNGRLDYVVKLTEGPNAKKKDKHDFVIEAKSSAVDLKEDHVNQTLSYCLNLSVEYFILTNAREWKLYKVINTKNKTAADPIWEVNLLNGTDLDTIAENMYVFSKYAYIEKTWEQVSDLSKATDTGDIMAIICSDKFVKMLCRQLKEIHDVKVSEGKIQDVLSGEIFKDYSKINKSLLKKLNADPKPVEKNTDESKKAIVNESDKLPEMNQEEAQYKDESAA